MLYPCRLPFLALLAVCAAADAAAPEARISVKVRAGRLGQFLEKVSSQAKVNFVLAEGIDQLRVDAMLEKVTVTEALDVVTQAHSLRYQRLSGGKTYLIARKDGPQWRELPPIIGGPALDRRVTISVRGAPLGTVIDTLSRQSGLKILTDSALERRRVTVYLDKVTVREALELILRTKGLDLRREPDGSYRITG